MVEGVCLKESMAENEITAAQCVVGTGIPQFSNKNIRCRHTLSIYVLPKPRAEILLPVSWIIVGWLVVMQVKSSFTRAWNKRGASSDKANN